MSPPVVEPPKKSYGRILKSSALIGGSTAFNMLFSIVRTKAMALLLGPSGVGLLGIYGSVSDLVRSVAGLGINSSGVRQIAESVGSGDSERMAITVTTLRRVALYSGTVGALLLIALSKRVSWVTFRDYKHVGSIALLALVALLLDISDAQRALVQGMRRISDLARMNILGAFYATVFSIVIVYLWRERGIVPSLICVAAMSIITSWWYARNVKVERVRITWSRAFAEASELVKFGVVVMANVLSTLTAAYIVRLFLLRNMGLKAAGLYQAAWALAGICINFILDAMGTDFYPRLTAIANDKGECNRLVNEQIEVGFLMAGPAMLAALSLAPLAIIVFYSAKFGGAVPILRWFCLGMLLRVLTWPIGFIFLARAERKLFFWTGVLFNAGYVALVWLGIKIFGLSGAGIAFFLLQVLHSMIIYTIAHHLTGFSWSEQNRKLVLILLPLVGSVFGIWYLIPPVPAAIIGTTVALPAGYYAIKTLCRLVPLDHLPSAAKKLMFVLRLAPEA
jgi:antigen flippase